MKYAFLTLAVLVLTGCNATSKQPSIMPPLTPPQAYVEPEQQYANPGSLYRPSEQATLFTDNRASRIGDVVMVKIIENAIAENTADLTSNKETTTSFGVDAFFGQSNLLGIPIGGAALGTNSTTESSSDGSTERSGTVTATVAARVTRVLPGNLLQIEGARQTRVNNETQYLVVTGLIRPSDILADNSIPSNRIADAHIAYYGEGVVSDTQNVGWFTRLMNNVWPF